MIGAIQGADQQRNERLQRRPDNLDYVVQDMSSKTVAAKAPRAYRLQRSGCAPLVSATFQQRDTAARAMAQQLTGPNFQTALTANAGERCTCLPVPTCDYTLFIPSGTRLFGTALPPAQAYCRVYHDAACCMGGRFFACATGQRRHPH